MAINDKAVITAAGGYVFVAAPGTAAPTPAELDTIDPALFGAQVQTLTGSPTAGTFAFKLGTATSTPVPYNATAAQIQGALETMTGIGAGNAHATGDLATGVAISFTGRLQGKSVDISIDSADLTGTLTLEETTAPNGWSNIGHTSREDMPEFGFDGGDTEVKGTWQNIALREVETESPADYLTLFLHQFDTESFELYYGKQSENTVNTKGVFGVAGGTKQPNEKALLIIIVDGDVRIGFYASKASVRRDDAIQMPSDEFAALPIRATFLKNGANDLYDWISEDLFD